MYNVIHFLLTPDKSASRRLRRIVAANAPMIGVMVGTWPELVVMLQQNYHLPESTDIWETSFQAAAVELTDAFWAKSLEVAEKETLVAVEEALVKLLEGTEPGKLLQTALAGQLSERAARHLNDLVRLHKKMDLTIPAHLSIISALLAAPRPAASRQIVLYGINENQQFSPWQNELLKKVAADCSALPNPLLDKLYRSAFVMSGADLKDSTLAHLQNSLFTSTTVKVARDQSIQWVAARDYLEEVEVAIGMIQTALRLDPALKYADIGILLPTDTEYARAVQSVLTQAGLPVSALANETALRDIGRETVLHFLLALRQPAPIMALAALVTSPLMSWPVEKGIMLATRIMGGDADLDEILHLTRHIESESILPAELDAALLAFSRFLKAGEGMEVHLGRARQTIVDVRSMVQGVELIPWKEILAAAAPEEYFGQKENSITREGIAVFSEREEPWRQVRMLFVLGFAAGHYPLAAGSSPVFGETDLEELKGLLGYGIQSRTDIARYRRELFRRQLLSASEKVTFLMPRRNGLGESIHPAETLTFMAQLLTGLKSPEELIYDLDSVVDRDKVQLLARAVAAEPQPPRTPEPADVNLEVNLLKLRATKEGEQKPESPSGLETLMVSPLAWLFRRFNMEPKEWVPEELDMMGKGSLAHLVFEHLFAPGVKTPTASEIRNQVPQLLHNAISELMPFMLSPEWRVERRHLEKDIIDAALHWSELLLHLRAEVLGVEVKMHGKLDELSLTGNADLLLKLPDGRLYIVDYKKSKSKSRRDRMTKGYDSQAHLYRLMLQTGSVDEEKPELAAAIGSERQIGVMYYMLNDQTALADTTGWSDGLLGGFQELGAGISANAMDLIKDRIEQLEKGIITLNRSTDEEWFNKTAGTTPYALDNSPLIRLFLKNE